MKRIEKKEEEKQAGFREELEEKKKGGLGYSCFASLYLL